jgi:hypothetical protein
MKTPLTKTVAWLAAAMTVLTGGCVEPKGSSADASTNAPLGVVSVETVAGTNADGVEVVAAEAPTLRSGRANRTFPDEIAKVIELVEAGAGEEVVRAFVSRSSEPYELTLDDVLYLRDIGIPDGVVAAMMRRGAELRLQQAEVVALQTNLVGAVAEIKAALAARDEGAPEPAAPGAPAVEGQPGQELAAVAGTPGTPGPAPLPQPAASVPADAPTEVQPFYETLSPYGSWYQVPSYGWVWQPSVVVVDTGWSPYRHGGRWVWSDWGWYWSSEYSWGWAPFHYGRWATYPGLGWCWVPGTVWGPSWVTWRNHGSYVGWAPLPPYCGWSSGVGLTWHGGAVSVGFGFGLASSCYTFVSYGNFCHRNVSHHALRRDHVETVYNNSTVVNNVIHGNNNTIINNGVGYETVASKSRSEIPKARIEPLPASVDQPVRVDRMERSKDGLVVYRPTPVAEEGGRPTAFRAEARPSSASAGLNASGVPTRGASTAPSRPGYDSRFANGSTAPSSKPMETRGITGNARPGSLTAPNAAAGRPMAGPTRTPSVSRTPTPNSFGSPAPKAVDGRSTQPQTRSAAPYATATPSTGATLGPSRQTTPVPLSDPSRYLPRSATPAPTTKPNFETRGATQSPTAPASSVYTPAARTAAPRAAVPQAGPKVDYSRSASPGYSPGAVRAPASTPLPASRPAYSAPAPASRPSYSAPAPVMTAPTAPRQSFSAPSPAMRAPSAPSAPRPSVSAPAPAGASPARGGGGNGGRSQAN